MMLVLKVSREFINHIMVHVLRGRGRRGWFVIILRYYLVMILWISDVRQSASGLRTLGWKPVWIGGEGRKAWVSRQVGDQQAFLLSGLQEIVCVVFGWKEVIWVDSRGWDIYPRGRFLLRESHVGSLWLLVTWITFNFIRTMAIIWLSMLWKLHIPMQLYR